MHFQLLAAAGRHGGVEAEARHAAFFAERALGFHHKHAAQSIMILGKLHIGGGAAYGAAELGAVFHMAAEHIIVAEQLFCIIEAAV